MGKAIDLFTNVAGDTILTFLKEMNLHTVCLISKDIVDVIS